MNGPTFPTLEQAGHYGLGNVNAGMAASFTLRRVLGRDVEHRDESGLRFALAAIRYAAVLRDRDGRIIEESCA